MDWRIDDGLAGDDGLADWQQIGDGLADCKWIGNGLGTGWQRIGDGLTLD